MKSFAHTTPALVAALLDDPFYRAIVTDFVADHDSAARVLGSYFEYSLSEAERTGRCILADNPQLGASAWLLPRSTELEASESASKASFLAATLGPRGNSNYWRIIEFMSPRASLSVPAEAWYLSIIGIDPAAQGQGIGAQLLMPTLTEADAAGAVCYLETFSPRNVMFYERLRFRSVASYLEPCTGAPYVIMRRDACGAP
jgi:GNAT superfamily N-acetyltransferase